MDEKNKSFVYENTEVILTGRRASKTLRSGRVEKLYEITPKHSTSGVWKKWVALSLLYTVDDSVSDDGN